MPAPHLPPGTQRAVLPRLFNLGLEFSCSISVGGGDTFTAWGVQFHLEDEDGERVEQIGRAGIAVTDLHMDDLFNALDFEDIDLGRAAHAVSDALDQYLPRIATNLDGGLLIANSLTLEPHWRGHGLGPLLLAEAVEVLHGGIGLFVCHPSPIPQAHQDDDSAQWRADQAGAATKLARTWAKVGFEPMPNDPTVMFMSGDETRRTKALGRLRKKWEKSRSVA